MWCWITVYGNKTAHIQFNLTFINTQSPHDATKYCPKVDKITQTKWLEQHTPFSVGTSILHMETYTSTYIKD